MTLYVLRHGIAVARSLHGSANDAERPLTEKGMKKMRRIARAMKREGIAVDAILSSPFRRARETAAIVAEECARKVSPVLSPHLKVGGKPAALLADINGLFARRQRILLVGHEPYLSRMISMLVSGKEGVPMTLKKGGLCKLSVESLRYGRCATLEWLMGPAQILRGK